MAKNIGLDDLFSDNKPQAVNDGDITDLVVTAKPNKKQQSKETSANSIFEKYAVKLYMVDCSGSTRDSCVDDGEISLDWPEDLKKHLHRVLTSNYGRLEEVLDLKDKIDTTEIVDLKQSIIDIGADQFGIYPKHNESSTKMGVMKRCIGDLVEKKYDKDPEARIALGTFEMEAHIEASDRDRIKFRLSELRPGGGTSIMNALQVSLDYFEKYPSPVNIHQLILVTDGEDWNAVEATSLLPRMQELGVTLDYIFLKNKGTISEGASAVAKVFSELCKTTGGEYVEVDSPSQFEKKLIVASDRLCLPPGA